MKKQDWVEKIVKSSCARIMSFFLFVVFIGSFTFLALRANTNLVASHEFQITLAQQTHEVGVASSMNDFYNKGWLANDQNFSELAGYVRKLVHLAASQALDPKFKQELNDYILKSRSQLPKEAEQIQGLSFSEGILRQDQSRLLDMYDQLSLVFQTMKDIVSYWDVDTPQARGEKMITIQDAFYIASIEFQATTTNHQKILKYAKLLDTQSKQANATELDRIRSNRTQLTLSVVGLTVSVLLFAGWVIFLAYHRRRRRKDFGGLSG